MQTPLLHHRLLAASFLLLFSQPRVRGLSIALLCLLLVGSSGLLWAQAPQSFYVTTTGTMPPSAATSWANSTSDLQGVIDYAAANTTPGSATVYVANGLYNPGGAAGSASASYTIASGVTVMGGYAGSGTPGARTAFPSSSTLTGAGTTADSYHVVQFLNASGQTRLDGFVITGGRANTLPEVRGGGIFNVSNGSSPSSPALANLVITGNSASFGGGIYNDASVSGALASPTLTNVNFSQNTATSDGGGAMYNSGFNGISSPVLNSVTFTANQAFNSGGALFNRGANTGGSSPSLTNVDFSQNTANSPATNGGGGAIYNEASNGAVVSPTLTNVTFSGNRAVNNGGAVHNFGNQAVSSPVLNNVRFTANRAISGGGMFSQAGGPGSEASPTLTNVIFSQNTATGSSTNNGGGALYQFANVGTSRPVLNSVTFTANLSQRNGGGVFILAGGSGAVANPTLTNVSFSQNTATNNGGGFYAQGGTSTLSNVTFTANRASIGGGIHTTSSHTLTATNSLLQSNTATNVGGGLYVEPGSSNLSSVTVVANRANEGGGIYTSSNNLRVTNSLLQSNTSTVSGGGLFINGGTTNLSSLTISDNRAGNEGGGIITGNGGGLTVTNSVLRRNTATTDGGGLFTFGNGSSTLSSLTVSANQAGDQGGGIYVTGSYTLRATNSLLQSNTANTDGAGLFVNSGTTGILINTALQDNKANALGGSIRNLGTVTSTNGSFGYNVASNGGSVIANGGNVTFTNGVFFGNGPGNAFTGTAPTVRFSLLDGTNPMGGFTDGGNNRTATRTPFVDGPNGNLRLNACAQSIDAGSNTLYNSAGGPATDLDNQNRFINTTIDMGAYEFSGTPGQQNDITMQPPSGSVVCSGSIVSIPVSVSGSGPFSAQLYRGGMPVGSPQSGTTFVFANVQVSDAGTYSVVVNGGCNSVTSTAFSLTVNESPTVTLVFNNSATVMGSGVPTITVPNQPGQSFQVFGGSRFQRVVVIDRINGYEIRQTDDNTTGIFPINRLGLFSLTVTGSNGCSRTVQGILAYPVNP